MVVQEGLDASGCEANNTLVVLVTHYHYLSYVEIVRVVFRP